MPASENAYATLDNEYAVVSSGTTNDITGSGLELLHRLFRKYQ